MKANEVSLNSFLSQTKTQFIIPVYQRNYDWTEEQCHQLFLDIIEVGSKPEQTHFIGSIVFIHDGVYTSSDVRHLVIIDGQQRLTTFSILYLALYKFANLNGFNEKAAEISDTYLVNKYVKDESSKLKLKQSDVNAKALRYLINDNEVENYSEFSKVINNYNYFIQHITTDNFETILNGLNSLLFVEISLERGKDDPQRIFESLNSTGLELSQADLIRNYILMGLEPKEQLRVFENYWEQIENNAKDYNKEESRVSDFIRDFLTYKSKKIPNKNSVYDEFKIRYSERNEKFYNEIIQEIKEFSYHYSKLLNPSLETDSEISKELSYINRLEINVSFPFILPVYNDYKKNVISKNEFIHVLKLIQSFIWRRFITGLPTHALNKIFMTLYSDVVKTNYIKSIEKSLVKKKSYQRFPNNIEIENVLFEKDVYSIQSKNSIYFLELLENHNNKEFVSIDNPNITIEHIFPQNPDKSWYNSLNEEEIKLFKEKYLNTISNLTLSGNNGSLSNKSFEEKKLMNRDGKEQGYVYSRLWLNTYLKQIDNWDINKLQERYKILLERFLEIWKFPDITIEDDIEEDEDYTIYNSPDPKHKKLDYFIFRDEKIVADDISKMYYHVIKKIFEENPSAVNHLELKNLLGISNNPQDLRIPFQINSSYYIEANNDNNTKFRRLKTLLTKFNLEDDLLINFSNKDFEDNDSENSDRTFWEEKSTNSTLPIVEKCFEFLNEFNTDLKPHYTQAYIGIKLKNKVENFVIFLTQHGFVRVAIRVKDVDKWINTLEKNNFQIVGIGKKTVKESKRIKFRITYDNIEKNYPIIKDILETAYNEWY